MRVILIHGLFLKINIVKSEYKKYSFYLKGDCRQFFFP